MIRGTCLEKVRDEHDNIIAYKININGKISTIDAKDLKRLIKTGEWYIENLTLTKDDRLVSSKVSYMKGTKEKELNIGLFRETYANSKIYTRYQRIFDTIGVDVLSAVYMSIPKPGDTIESILQRTYKLNLIQVTAKELLNNPVRVIGCFSDREYTSDYISPNINKIEHETAFIGRDTKIRIPLLLLHYNGNFRLVAFGEITYSYAFETDLFDFFSKDVKDSLAIVTLDKMLKSNVTRLGKRISIKECKQIASLIVNSDIKYWVGTEATKCLMSSLDKENTTIKLKASGVTTLGIPFGIVLLLGSLGGFILGGLADGVYETLKCETVEEFAAQNIGGPLLKQAVRNYRKNNV